MVMKSQPWPLLILLVVLLCIYGQGYAQSEAPALPDRDSILAEREQQAGRLLAAMDSLRLADTIQRRAIRAQLEGLTPEDSLQGAVLQIQLDSLGQNLQSRQAALNQQMDSLRSITSGVPVVLRQDTLFFLIAGQGPFGPVERAGRISEMLNQLEQTRNFDFDILKILEDQESAYIMFGEEVLATITDRDAWWSNQSRKALAEQYTAKVRDTLATYRDQTQLISKVLRLVILVLVLGIFWFGIRYLNRMLTWMNVRFLRKGKHWFIRELKFRHYQILSAEQGEELLRRLLIALKWLIIAFTVYALLPVVFSIFPVTKPIATKLLNLILNPVKSFAAAFIGYLPELFTIIVVILITRYFLLFLKFVSREVETGHLKLPGFYEDWAQPTYNLLKILIIVFAFVIIFPYLPGSDSPAFQGVGVFLGLLVSLGSSSAISNIIAGLVIIYMRAFKIGDRVKIGDTTGDVIEKTMLITRVRTIKNEEVTIPNSTILNGNTINYSANAEKTGLILNTTVTIGYDVPWRQVQELLAGAALKTEHIKEQPEPFILQTSLDDFYVSYQVNAYTGRPELAAKIYSELHSNIQDAFNEAGVEILSPHYRAARDGNMITIPPDFLPKDYKAPAFNVKMDRNGQNNTPPIPENDAPGALQEKR